MAHIAAVIPEHLQEWGLRPLRRERGLRNAAPARIAATLAEFCRRSLGASIERAEFFHASVGSVRGLRLRDRRRVVVKIHRPGTSAGFLVATQTVQRNLAAGGFPSPEPLLSPAAIGRGVAVTESLLDRCGRADAHDPAIRRELAGTLARLGGSSETASESQAHLASPWDRG